jgi:3-deoxy-manno-octulosonate cytidylyltransferase (CMP-KDO synthetase)
VKESALVVVVVPGRGASTRLPRKLFLTESGKPLYAHALERCLAARTADRVLAAVDGPELAAIARAAGAEPVLTDPALASGTDRVWAAVRDLPEAAIVLNVQGDEPEIEPEAVDAVIGAVRDGAEVATLAAPLPPEAFADPARVKVVVDLRGDALYFSRAPIPHPRFADGPAAPRLHLGIYGFRREALRRFTAWPPSALERTEGLEQLRLLEHGVRIRVLDWPRAASGIDTRADYDAFLLRSRRAAATPLP